MADRVAELEQQLRERDAALREKERMLEKLQGHAGELPEEQKWAHLTDHLLDTSSEEGAWEVLDIRWDDPDILQRR